MFLVTITSNHNNFCLECSNNDNFSFLVQLCRAVFPFLRHERNAINIFFSFLTTQERLNYNICTRSAKLFVLCILSQASNCITAMNPRDHISSTHHGVMPTPNAKFWALLCMSCLCTVIIAYRLRQAHVFFPEAREAYLVACKWKLFSEFFSVCRFLLLYLGDE